MTPTLTPEAWDRVRIEKGSHRPGWAMQCLKNGMLRKVQRRLTVPPGGAGFCLPDLDNHSGADSSTDPRRPDVEYR